MNRFRIWLAVLLCKGTSCIVARSAQVIALQVTVLQLAEYVEKSGAVASNWKAHKVLTRACQGMLTLVQDILVGGFVTSPTVSTSSGQGTLEIEETSDGKEEEKATAVPSI